ncbi:MAG: type I restriction-modification enzyme R subunit C-terminal domain-containing protein [Paludibaculum sp.]
MANLTAGRGVAIREFPLRAGHGFADYMLYVDESAIGVLEAKKDGVPLTGVELQTSRYSLGLPDNLPAFRRPLPFLYQATSKEIRFTNLLEPDSAGRAVFALHRPETLADWQWREIEVSGSTTKARIRRMPELITADLWPAQVKAIKGLEKSLADSRPRSLIQMATGSGKTFTACNFVYRLIQHANARRVLFLVDRNNLGRQTLKEFQAFRTPDDGRTFTELYNIQHLKSNKLDTVSRVTITTIQRLFSMLKGDPEIDPALEEGSLFQTIGLPVQPFELDYNPSIPIETFDFIVTDECHRSIYNLWRQVLEYFDASLIGLTATPSKQTLGFFNQNLVMEYNHDQAVADGVNVQYDVYRIRTKITEQGSKIEAGFYVDTRDRKTREVRYQQLDQDLPYSASQLDRDVVASDQIRTVIRTFRDQLPLEIFPGRTEVPKTLIFAKDDSHADDILKIVREEFGRGNDFAQKITYRSDNPEQRLQDFRTSYLPRIVVTVDMIATGTDVKPLEIVFFLRDVKSLNYFEQMKGRGVRVVSDTDFQAVTPGGLTKTHFVIVDAVGLCEGEMQDSRPLERQPGVSLDRLIEAVAFGSKDPTVVSSLAAKLARLDRRLKPEEHQELRKLADGRSLSEIVAGLVHSIDPDAQVAAAKETSGPEPTAAEIKCAAQRLITEAVKPIMANTDWRTRLLAIKRSYEQIIDTVSQDVVLEAAFSADAKEKARSIVTSFREFIEQNKDEITALQVLYSRPFKQRLTYSEIKDLAAAIRKPHPAWTPDELWRAYETLDRSRVRGSGRRILTDLVSLVRFATETEGVLRPFNDTVKERFLNWLAEQEQQGRSFTEEQRLWLEAMADHIGASVSINADDFDETPFAQKGGLARAYRLFGEGLPGLLEELNVRLVA